MRLEFDGFVGWGGDPGRGFVAWSDTAIDVQDRFQ